VAKACKEICVGVVEQGAHTALTEFLMLKLLQLSIRSPEMICFYFVA